jgi:tetratricopeptide (TPR) repeat protein
VAPRTAGHRWTVSNVGTVSARGRVVLLVAVAAVAAAGVTVGATLLTSNGENGGGGGQTTATPRPGAPPLLLDLGVRTDPEARALRRALLLYGRGRRRAAGRIFARYDSLEARVGAALAAWPSGLARMATLAVEQPASSLVQLHDGLALYWVGRAAAARNAWRRAKRLEPDSSYAVRAGDLLHPELPIPGLPFFVPSFPSPQRLFRLSPPQQLEFLAARSGTGGAREKLLYGAALQKLGRPLSAERQFRAAAALEPRNPDAQVAVAIGLFDKDAPKRAFARLGPLTRTFPNSATVRFHLGLLLLWLGRVDEAKRQLRLARGEAPDSRLGREAKRFLDRLAGTTPRGTGR